MATTASSNPASTDDLRSRGQQPTLASQRSKEQTNTPSEANRTSRIGGFFPLGYKAGFSQWWANTSPALAEHTVLSFVPYLQKPPTHMHTGSAPTSTTGSTTSVNTDPSKASSPVRTSSLTDPYGPRSWHSTLVKLSGKNRALNEFSVSREGEEVEESLVMLHGYGAGLGFFYKNFEGLSRVKGLKLYALDMLGMGRSSRPPFRVHAKDREGKITEAESWFVDALEEWRVIRKIDKFTLLGHSMGGYMAVAYAIKYPGHLNKLILASPVGIPEDPFAVAADMPEPGDSTMANEFSQDQEADIVNPSKKPIMADGNKFMNPNPNPTAPTTPTTDASSTTPAVPRRPIPKWLTYLWDANVSPFSIVRWSGPLGPRFISGWTTRRFSHLPPNEAEALHQYSYAMFKQRGSGEYALAYILAPGAFARSPLIRRIQNVGRGEGEKGVPVVMMYGENDWMDIAGGYAAEEKIRVERERILEGKGEAERENDRGIAKVLVIQKAGHHVYLDGYDEFNEVMREEMAETKRDIRVDREGR